MPADRCKSSGRRTYVGKHAFHNSRSRDGTQDLRDKNYSGAEPGQAADEHEAECHSWIEETAANAEEDPSVDCETESESKRDVQELRDTRRQSRTTLLAILEGDVGRSKGEEEEHEGAEELANELGQRSAVNARRASVQMGRGFEQRRDDRAWHSAYSPLRGRACGRYCSQRHRAGWCRVRRRTCVGLVVGCSWLRPVAGLIFFLCFCVAFFLHLRGGWWGWCQCRRCDAKRADSLMV